jgi:hypothetical protein
MYALRACVRYPGLQAFWFRRTFPELQQSVLRMLARYGYGRMLGFRWNESRFELRNSNGSVLTFGHAKNLQEASALLSAELNLLVIDERTTIPSEVTDLLYSRVRSGVAGVPCLGIRSATNPGQIAHAAVKRDFIDATRHGEVEILDRYGRRRTFIQARLGDTPQLGDEYRKALAGLPERLRKAYEEGDWSTFEGQVFPELSWDRHVVQPFTIPDSWNRYVGIDWGYTAPYAVGWFAQDEDQRIWLYREIYRAGVGEAEQARRILEAEAGEHIMARFADDAMFAVRGDARPISDIYRENGVYITAAGKSPGSRVAGLQRIHSYLADAPACPHHRAQGWEECPLLHAFTTCPNWYAEMESLPHASTGNPEDSAPSAPDHLVDLTRYVLLNLGGGAQAWIDWARKKAEQLAAGGPEPPADEPAALPSPEPGQAPVSPEEARKRLRDAAFRDQRFAVTSG